MNAGEFEPLGLLQAYVVADVRPTGRMLGHGSYGHVEEAAIPGASCVVKRLHEALLPCATEALGADRMKANFVAECRLMSSLRHPHIVQFLGVCFMPGSRLPALLMEKLWIDLHALLVDNPNLPLSLKHSFLLDTAKGLTYLHTHSPPVIHRDLSARNVLLNSAMVAKIADLGNSRIIDVSPNHLMMMTKNPGNLWYMPPEAQMDIPEYNASIDVFSFGVLSLFTLSQEFPALQSATQTDPVTEKMSSLTEVERRAKAFSKIPLEKDHTLVCLIEQCLHNLPNRRPAIGDVLKTLEEVGETVGDQYSRLNYLDVVKLHREAVQQKEPQIKPLKCEIATLQSETEAQHIDLLEKEVEMESLKSEIELQQSQISRLRKQLQGKSFLEAEAQQIDLLEKEVEIESLKSEIELQQSQISRLRMQLQGKEERLQSMQQDYETELQETHSRISTLEAVSREELLQKKALKSELELHDDQILRLRKQLQGKEERLQSMQHDYETELQESRSGISKLEAVSREEVLRKETLRSKMNLLQYDYEAICNLEALSQKELLDKDLVIKALKSEIEVQQSQVLTLRKQFQSKEELLQSMQHDHTAKLQESKSIISKLEAELREQGKQIAVMLQQISIQDVRCKPKAVTPGTKYPHSLPSAATASIPIPRSVVGKERTIVVTTRTAKGEPHPHGGEDVQATLTFRGSAGPPISTPKVHDNSDGTYAISFTTRQVGEHELRITIERQSLVGSPYAIYSRQARSYTALHFRPSCQRTFTCLYSSWGIAISDSMKLFVTNSGGCIQVFDQTGRNVDTIGCKGSLDGQFRNPLGIALRGDVMYVADTFNDRVQKLSVTGELISKFGALKEGDKQLSRPYGICLDHDSKVFVADLGNSRVSVFDENGVFLYHITGDPSTNSQLCEPRGLALDPSGNLHVVDYKLNSIKVFSPRGNFVAQYGNGHLEKPMYIAIDDEGYAFISDDKLSIFDPQHNVIHNTVKFDSTGVALDKNGCVYVANNARGNNEVLQF